jgi:Rod binding domain-containing protein
MSALPPIDQSLIPAEVRTGSAKDKQTYQAALGFERTLMDELSKAMTATAQTDGSDGSAGSDSTDDGGDDSTSSLDQQDASTSMYMQMLPDQLTNGLMQGGGLGLAKSFYDSMKDQGQ